MDHRILVTIFMYLQAVSYFLCEGSYEVLLKNEETIMTIKKLLIKEGFTEEDFDQIQNGSKRIYIGVLDSLGMRNTDA